MLKSNKIYQILTYSYSTMVPIRNGTHDELSISTGQSWTLESLPLWPLLIYSDPRVGIVCAQSTSLGDLKKKSLETPQFVYSDRLQDEAAALHPRGGLEAKGLRASTSGPIAKACFPGARGESTDRRCAGCQGREWRGGSLAA